MHKSRVHHQHNQDQGCSPDGEVESEGGSASPTVQTRGYVESVTAVSLPGDQIQENLQSIWNDSVTV